MIKPVALANGTIKNIAPMEIVIIAQNPCQRVIVVKVGKDVARMNKQEIEKAISNINYGLHYEDCGNMVMITKFAAYQAMSALEKQIPKKPKNIRNITFAGSAKIYFSAGECPNCGEYVDTDDDKYVCAQSGCYQAIDWRVEE